MARNFTDGAEMGDTAFWDVSGGSVQTATPSPFTGSGTYYYEIVSGASFTKNIAETDELYFRFRFYMAANSSTTVRFPAFRNGTTVLAYLTFEAGTGKIEAFTNTSVGSTSIAYTTSEWHLIEVYLKIANAPNGRFDIRIDGVLQMTFTGDTLVTAETTIDNFSFASVAGHNIDLDDLALNDTTGGSDNSWCGEGQIVSITPNGDGTTNDWDGSDGDSTNNYLLVDEVPKDDDTTYVLSDGATSGTQDQYALSDYSGTGYTILRIYTEARAKKTSADAASIKLGFLVSGGTDRLSAAQTLTTSYARYVGDEHTVNPETSSAWSEANLDALELVIETG